MKKLILVYVLCAVVLFLFSGVAEAGVVRKSAKAIQESAKVVSQPVRHPVKDAKRVGHVARVIFW